MPIWQTKETHREPLSRRRLIGSVLLTCLLSLLALFLAMTCGATTFSSDTYNGSLLWLRAPRALLGYATGGALAISGVAFQALLRNPLADPYVMGVSAGAALGGTIAIIFTGSIFLIPLCSFGGALLTIIFTMWLARRFPQNSALTMLLTGVVINAFASSLITVLKVAASATKAQELLFWLMGSLGYPAWNESILALVLVLSGALLLTLLAPKLNTLALGEKVASTLGINVERLRWVIYLAASLIVAAVVSIVGMIGFIGLVVPHILRLIIGPDHRLLLPCSFFGGATLLLLADTAARLGFGLFDTSLPVGVITSFFGGPFFLWLLARSKTTVGN